MRRKRGPVQDVIAVYVTPERMRHAREIVVEARERGSSGNVIVTGQRELQECALDVLYRNGRLGQPDDARRRYNAGFWLRELYLKTHPSEGIAAYSVRVEAAGEMSDAEAWNFRAYQDTARDLHRHWRILEQVCCDDRAQGNPYPIWEALDALSDLRDGYIPDYLV